MWEVNISSSSDGSRYPKWLVSVDQKPVPSGACCRLLGQASGGLIGKARSEDSQSQGRAFIHVPDGLVRHALPITDDGGVSLITLRPFCAEAGEFELVTVLYVLRLKNYFGSSNYQLD